MFSHYSYIVFISIIAFLFILSFLYPPFFWIIISFIYIVFETEHYRFDIFPLPLLDYILIVALNIILIIITVYYFFILKKQKLKFDNTEKWILIFLIGTLFSTGIGLIHGYNLKAILKEIGIVIGYFAFITVKRMDFKFLKILLTTLILGIAIVALEYIYLAKKIILSPYLLTHRVVTRQAVLAVPAMSIGFSLLLWGNKKEKILGVLLIIIFTPIVILSMQRALWFAIILGIIASILIGFFAPNTNKRKAIMLLIWGLLVLLTIITIGIVFVSNYFSDTYLNVLSSRINTFEAVDKVVEDQSYRVRSEDMEKALLRIKNYPYAFLIGRGFGDRLLRQYPFSEYIVFIDNTYITLLWKMGFIFFIVYFMLFYSQIKFFYKIVKKMKNNAWAIGIISFLISLLLFLMGTNFGLGYRFIFVFWGILGAGHLYYTEESQIKV